VDGDDDVIINTLSLWGKFSNWKSTDTAQKARELTREKRDIERGNVLVQSRSKLQQPLPIYVVVFLAKRKKNNPSRRGIIIINDE
jgi:hypothetical protein